MHRPDRPVATARDLPARAAILAATAVALLSCASGPAASSRPEPVPFVDPERVATFQQLLEDSASAMELLANVVERQLGPGKRSLDCAGVVTALDRQHRRQQAVAFQVFDPVDLADNAYTYAFHAAVRERADQRRYERRYTAAAERVHAALERAASCHAAWGTLADTGFEHLDPHARAKQELLEGPPWTRPVANEVDERRAFATITTFERTWSAFVTALPEDCAAAAEAIGAFRTAHGPLLRETRAVRRSLTAIQHETVYALHPPGDSRLDWFGREQTCVKEPGFLAATRALFAL